ncbi:MAG: IS630 family transposase [Deltaproteobacteria bacterium]|nr:IS630 family transposase [Deltaproteobacteria bacterium]
MNVRYIVKLTEDEREGLRERLGRGTERARKHTRAQILLACDRGLSDEETAQVLGCGTATIYRVKKRFVEEGLDAALSDRARPRPERKLSGREEAVLIALACSKPPTGRKCWTLELLAGEVVQLVDHDSISRETVRRRLSENDLKPWQKKMWCIPCVDAEFVERMEDVLDLYAETPDPKRPVVSFDEKPYQLIGETRASVRAKPGQPARIDYEYTRNGTVNIFVMVDAHRPWRHAKVTDQRTSIDFAECMRDLVDVHYPNADVIRVVLDNLSTHRAKNLYDAFPAPEARRILRRLEFHHTPKHASWLNMVEIEIGVLSGQCLDRRIPDRAMLEVHVDAWSAARNRDGHRINWMFRVDDARRKLGHAYPKPLFDTPLPAAA